MKTKRFKGPAYRGDTGFSQSAQSALEVVQFEEDELGNTEDFKHLTL